MKKKVVIICIVALCLVGCSNKKEIKVKEKKVIDQDAIKEEKVNEYIDNNPIKLALFVDNKKISEYSSSMTIYEDIVSLECYYTEDDSIIDGKFKDVFNHYYNNYKDIDNYKIGYHIKFNTSDGEISKYIYKPSDVESFFNYIQVYLYDDVHQDDSWYDHISKEEYNDSTLLTSIKLTASMYIDRVNSDVEVIAFSYKNGDIDSNGKYLGNSKYRVVIKHQ